MTREHGFTLPELLIGMTVAMIVLVGTFTLVKTAMDLSADVVQRTDAMQRSRLAMDRVTRQLRSQVCLDAATPAMVAGDENSATFYADLGSGGTPARHTLTYDPGASTLTETSFQGTASAAGAPVEFPARPTRVDELLEKVAPPTADPIFSYFAYTTSGSPRRPTVRLATPLSAADRARVARIVVNVVAQPLGTPDTSKSFAMREQITVRHADPNAVSPTPTCA